MSSESMRQLIESMPLFEVQYYNSDETKQMIMELVSFFGYLKQHLTDVKVPVNPDNPRAKLMLQGPGLITDYSNVWSILESGKFVLGGPWPWGAVNFSNLRKAESKIDFETCYIVFKVRSSDNGAFRMDVEYIAEGNLKEDQDTEVRITFVNGKDKIILDGKELSTEEIRDIFRN